MASIAGKMRSQSEHIKRIRDTLNNKKIIIGQKTTFTYNSGPHYTKWSSAQFASKWLTTITT